MQKGRLNEDRGGSALRWLALGAVSIACYALALVVFDPLAPIFSLLSDDAFYYFEIAQNITRGEGPTFDRIAPTNGFHPLWMLIAVAVYAVAGGGSLAPIVILMVINAVLAFASLYLLYRLVDRHIAPGFGAVAVAAGLLPHVFRALTNGMETGLVLFAVIVLLHACYRFDLHDVRGGPARGFAFGALLGVAALCRLDTVFLLVGFAVVNAVTGLAFKLRPTKLVLRAAATGLGFVLVISPYFAWGYLHFGELMPISGSVKSSFPELRDRLNLYGDMRFALPLLLVLSGLVIANLRRRQQRCGAFGESFDSPVVALWIGCLLHFLHAYLFLGWGFYWWHFSLYGLAFALALPEFLTRFEAERPRSTRAVALALTLSMTAIGVAFKAVEFVQQGEKHREWHRAATWAKENSEPGSVFALKDAGLFGYFSERRVVNLDGKANGYRYREYWRNGNVLDYLAEVGVSFIGDVNCRPFDGDGCMVAILRANRPPLILTLPSETHVYRGEDMGARGLLARGTPGSGFVIARLPLGTPAESPR